MRPARPHLLAAVAAAVLTLAACGGGGSAAAPASQAPTASASDTTLVLYNAQHEEVGKAWADAFTAKTGIKVDIRNGSDFDLANQIVAEGAASPADVFITENSPGDVAGSSKGLFAPVDAATKAQVPAQYSSSKGDWVGVAARSTVFVYNSTTLPEGQLPESLMDLAQPEWKDRFGHLAGGRRLPGHRQRGLLLKGDEAGAAWLQGVKDNARIYREHARS